MPDYFASFPLLKQEVLARILSVFKPASIASHLTMFHI